jgi:hypothetical protein
MSYKFKRLLEERRLVKVRRDKKLILKEIDGAEDDQKPRKSPCKMEISSGLQFKATIQCSTRHEHYCIAKDSGKRVIMHCLLQ